MIETRTRRRCASAAAVALALALVGCQQNRCDRQANLPPDPGETLPEWAFDAPHYFRPPPDLVPQPVGDSRTDLPGHYYVNRRVFMVDRPTLEVPSNREPRVAVWWTSTNGKLWAKAGHFGLGQTHFAFVGGDDGDYGLRFLGPGIEESLQEQTVPHRVYHLDTAIPRVQVSVAGGGRVVDPGAAIEVAWEVADQNLDPASVRLAVCFVPENPDEPQIPSPTQGTGPGPAMVPAAGAVGDEPRLWQPIPGAKDAVGSVEHVVPATPGRSIQFQVRTRDKAGNVGVGYSPVLHISGQSAANASPGGPA